MLRVRLTRDRLEVELTAPGGERFAPHDDGTAALARTCGTCEQADCFRHEKTEHPAGRTTVLLDEAWPEFRAFVAGQPSLGARDAPVAAALRGLSQRLAKTAPARRAAELRGSAFLGRRLARKLTPDVTDVTIAQSLLPTLWRDGHLGGRTFCVLMTRMPMAEIQRRLDEAACAHPGRKSLADFRADPQLLAAETEALAAAGRIVTPHGEIARLFGDRAVLLDWRMPKPLPRSGAIVPDRIAFPGPTIARKGAYEVREAARALDLEVVLIGGELEGAGFWNGIRTIRADASNWLDGVACVVQPALLEDAPRRLLQALASDVPVIATQACGLTEQSGLTLIENAGGLASALASNL